MAPGVDMQKLLLRTCRQGLAGIECLAGIPGTVGGGIRMNAGGKFGDFGAVIHRVTVMDNEGTVSSGKWQEYNDSPTLFTTATKQDGTERKMAVEHIKTDADTMTVKLYAIGDDGKPDDSKSGSLVFKRAK